MTTDVSAERMRLTEQVAEEIRALLARRRLSGRELARRMGASASWVNFRLTGTVEIGLDDLQRFAEALDVDYFDLIPSREGRVVSHIGASRRQTTVPKVGSLTVLTKRRTTGSPPSPTSAIPPIATLDRRVSRQLTSAA